MFISMCDKSLKVKGSVLQVILLDPQVRTLFSVDRNSLVGYCQKHASDHLIHVEVKYLL